VGRALLPVADGPRRLRGSIPGQGPTLPYHFEPAPREEWLHRPSEGELDGATKPEVEQGRLRRRGRRPCLSFRPAPVGGGGPPRTQSPERRVRPARIPQCRLVRPVTVGGANLNPRTVFVFGAPRDLASPQPHWPPALENGRVLVGHVRETTLFDVEVTKWTEEDDAEGYHGGRPRMHAKIGTALISAGKALGMFPVVRAPPCQERSCPYHLRDRFRRKWLPRASQDDSDRFAPWPHGPGGPSGGALGPWERRLASPTGRSRGQTKVNEQPTDKTLRVRESLSNKGDPGGPRFDPRTRASSANSSPPNKLFRLGDAGD